MVEEKESEKISETEDSSSPKAPDSQRFDESWRRYQREMRRYKRETQRKGITISWKKIGLSAGIFAVIAVVIAALIFLPSLSPLPQINRAPNFTLSTFDGDSFTLSDFDGNVVLLNFMSTTCSYCIEELYDLKIVEDTFPNLIMISISTGRESNMVLEEFAQTHNITWFLAADTGTANVAGRYSIASIPTTIILDQQRQKYATHVGKVPASVLVGDINELITPGRVSIITLSLTNDDWETRILLRILWGQN
jgi:peroxiredoxin